MSEIVYRSFQPDTDIEAVVELGNLCGKADGHEQVVTVEDIQHQLAAPFIDPERDILVAVTVDGPAKDHIVGLCNTILLPDGGKAFGGGNVHPDYRRQGIGQHMVQVLDARLRARAEAEFPPEQPVYIQRAARDTITGAIKLFESEGYEEIRQFYTMRIEFNGPIPPPEFPDGIELRPFDRERHGRAVYEADQEAFRDHWSPVALSFEDWQHMIFNTQHFDPGLWFIAWDGDQVAGSSLCRPFGEGDPDLGWVGELSVRRPWRRRGLGLALLRHSFHVFQQKGFTRAGLGVDASSKTNAVALYERAGMFVYKRSLAYRKVLHGDPALIED
ncbi:MAG: GNAT family N-acetyltransferase [Anaerolineae bacterium]|nr:GNAT family N-acetyltransferase [Anaerolineae bacterium]